MKLKPKLRGRLWGVLALAAAAPAFPAEYYVIPQASLTAEADTNLDLQPASQGTRETVEGYIADAAAIFGIATPNSDTTIRPRVDYRDYPKDSSDDRFEQYLDLNSVHRGERDRASVYLGFERRDDFNAEQNSALYNEYAPPSPTSPETGHISERGETRTSLLLLPNYSYNLSPLTAIGISGIYQNLSYSPSNDVYAIDFNYYQAKLYLSWNLSQKNQFTVGAYGADYNAEHVYSRAVAEGLSAALDTTWTPLLSTTATVLYQRTDTTSVVPSPIDQNNNPWGASIAGMYKTQLDQFRLDAGRQITPSGGGGIFVNDSIQLQYDRTFTPRLKFTTATIALKNHGLTSNVIEDQRKFVRTVVEFKYMLAPTWYLQGGYQYMWEKYELLPDGADNNRIYLRFGYQGRDRQF